MFGNIGRAFGISLIASAIPLTIVPVLAKQHERAVASASDQSVFRCPVTIYRPTPLGDCHASTTKPNVMVAWLDDTHGDRPWDSAGVGTVIRAGSDFGAPEMCTLDDGYNRHRPCDGGGN
jgi:hypothetical protein